MENNNKLNENQAKNVSGGIVVDGHTYVKINKKDIESYEYRCKTCGYVLYINKDIGYYIREVCPRCRYISLEKTGRFCVDYDKCISALGDA